MKDYLGIEHVKAIEVLDSRGNPALQVEVVTEGGFSGTSTISSETSSSSYSAHSLQDGDVTRYGGKGVQECIKNVDRIATRINGMNVYDQRKIDSLLISLDDSKNKSNLGCNTLMGISVAVAKAASNSLGQQLYSYIGGVGCNTMPTPIISVINGGRLSDNNLNFQDFMIVPNKGDCFNKKIQIGTEIYHSLKSLLAIKKLNTSTSDYGGFTPNLDNDKEALDLIIEAIRKAGYIPKTDVSIALNIGANEMRKSAISTNSDGYLFLKNEELKTTDEIIDCICDICEKYPIIFVEDALSETDLDSWKKLKCSIGNKSILIGNDIFAGNISRLKKGIKHEVANGIIINPNYIGTLSETLDIIDFAKSNKYTIIISSQSGDIEDGFISDLAVATNAKFIKAGAPCRGECVIKYNRLISIEKDF